MPIVLYFRSFGNTKTQFIKNLYNFSSYQGQWVARAYFEAARRLKGEVLPITIPGEKRSLFGKIFGRKAA